MSKKTHSEHSEDPQKVIEPLQDLQKALEKAQREADTFKDLALRSQADFDNFRKRMIREREEILKFGNANVLEKILPIVDHFEMGLHAAGKHENREELLKGFELIFQQMQAFLKDQNVEAFKSKGEAFDPNFHNCIAVLPNKDCADGTIVEVLKPGYKIGERLLRPASVVVANQPESHHE